MLQDQFNYPVTTQQPYVIEAANHFQLRLVSFDPKVTEVFDSAECYQDNILLQLYAASLFIWNQTEHDAIDCDSYLQRIDKLLATANSREKGLAEAIKLGLDGDFLSAISCYENLGQTFPQDPVIIKFLEFHCFETGESERQLAFMEQTAKFSKNSHVLAMYAFALELNNEMILAEQVALQALDIDRNTPWAFHCLAHVYFNVGETQRAIALLDESADVWQRCNVYIQAHMAFHRTIFYFCTNRATDALVLFDSTIWGDNVSAVLQHTDAILFLWCADIIGIDVAARWKMILPHIRTKALETVFPYLNAFYLLALFRAGDIAMAREVVTQVKKHAALQTGKNKYIWAELGVPLVEGVLAFAEGNFVLAVEKLQKLWRDNDFGGSDEQRLPLMWTYLHSLAASDNREELDKAVTVYLNGRSPNYLEMRWC